MKKLLFLSILLVVVACESIPVYEFPPGQRIGLVTTSLPTQFCHRHVGVTIFGDQDRKLYESDYDLKEILNQSLNSVAEANGHTYIEISDKRYVKTVGGYYEPKNALSDVLVPVPANKSVLESMVEEYDLDLFFLMLDHENTDELALKCNVELITHGVKNVAVTSKITLWAFKADSLEYLGMNQGLGGEFVETEFPQDLKNLTPAYIAEVRPAVEADVLDGVKYIFSSANLGEQDYKKTPLPLLFFK